MRPGYRLDCCLWRETPPCIFNNLPPKRLGPACLLVSTPIASFQSRHNSSSFFFFSCPFLFPLKRSGRLPPLSRKPKFLSLHLPFLSLYLSFVSLSCFFFSSPAWPNYKRRGALSLRCYRENFHIRSAGKNTARSVLLHPLCDLNISLLRGHRSVISPFVMISKSR